MRETGMNAIRRGSVYVLVLGVSLLVVTIGVGAALAARADLDRRSSIPLVSQAEWAALAGLELALQAMTEETLDVRRVAPAEWVLSSSIDGVQVSIRFSDPDDGELQDDDTDRVKIESRARIGDVIQVRSCIAEPRLDDDARPSKWGVVPGTYRIEPAS